MGGKERNGEGKERRKERGERKEGGCERRARSRGRRGRRGEEASGREEREWLAPGCPNFQLESPENPHPAWWKEPISVWTTVEV